MLCFTEGLFVLHTKDLTSKSCKIPIAKHITKNSMDFLVPEQLITNKTEGITRRMIQDKNRNYPSTKIQFIGLPQGYQKIYDQIVWKVSQTLDPR